MTDKNTIQHVDLQRFCGHDEFYARLAKPFSRGDYTWATDGKVVVRVPRRDDVPDREDAPDAGRLWPASAPAMTALRAKSFPDPESVKCDVCSGRGTEHDCPDCTCECDICAGSGHIEQATAVSIGGRAIQLKYAKLLMGLPAVEIDPAPADYLVQFRFDGGEGLLSLLAPNHRCIVVADLLREDAIDDE